MKNKINQNETDGKNDFSQTFRLQEMKGGNEK